ncbi:MAG: nucleoside-diphosphate sugar epimerase/dehydratase [Pseudomonadota bacterium]
MGDLHNRLTRGQKAAILLVLDGLAMVASLWIALQLRLGELWPDRYWAEGWGLFVLMPLIGMAYAWTLGIPRIVLRSFEGRAILRLLRFAFIMSVVCAVLNASLAFGLPRSIPGIWGAVFLALAVIGRLTLIELMERSEGAARIPVVIYGAGATGQQLMAALRTDRDVRPVAFLDDNAALARVAVSGLRVYPPERLPELVASRGVRRAILAMPSASPQKRRRIVERLKAQSVDVQTLPSFEEMLDGRALSDQLRPVSADDLLGRDRVDLASPEVASAYTGKTVMITGAGGSIGSELCRQVLVARPARLVLFEISEYALYTIEMELRASAAASWTELVPVLGSVTDERAVAHTLAANGVEIVLHAAAYKHVPLLEDNAVEGARNNVLGTRTLTDACLAAGVERFILVSSDKAVRPTNVMGATKRMAELVVQDRQTRARGTVLTMVRFGNVLGSSGSVIPLFRAQIEAGGPVTLTHPDVTRYFMTIPEAAQLVLLAGSFAAGGEVFVLDMGTPVKIRDLARSLIELSGRTVRDEATPDGDIEIRVTGLRPGEKLYEELLIGDDVIPTPHPKILRAAEAHLSEVETASALSEIEGAVRGTDAARLRRILSRRIGGYAPNDTALPAE